jgi:sugar phosphate isomerase/epimerase
MQLIHEKISRRTMFAWSGRLAALAAASSPLAPLLAAPGSRWFKIGSCDWSLGKHRDPAALDVARQLGFDGLQISMGGPEEQLQFCRPDVQKKYQEAAQRSNVVIASVATDAMWQGPLESDPRAARWLSDSVDTCQALKLPICMIVNFNLDLKKKPELDHFVTVMKDIAPKAEKKGVIIGMENLLSAEDNMRLIDMVGSPALKVYYDVGNSTDKGYDILKEIRTLGKRNLICEFHFKDGKFMLGEGRIDFKQVRKALDDINYSGWLQIEAETPHGLIPDYTADREYLEKIFPRNPDKA